MSDRNSSFVCKKNSFRYDCKKLSLFGALNDETNYHDTHHQCVKISDFQTYPQERNPKPVGPQQS